MAGSQFLREYKERIDSLLNQEIPMGKRHQVALIILSFFKIRDDNKETTKQMLLEWNEAYAQLPEQELIKLIDDIFDRDTTYAWNVLKELHRQ